MNRLQKTAPMLKHKIQWREVADKLDISKVTLASWRKSGDPNKNQVIDETVEELVQNK